MSSPRPPFSLPWIVLLLGAAALFIAVTQPQAGEGDATPVSGAAICRSGMS